jgi:RNA polymerase sigma factor (sigma-70 family)
LSTIAIRPFPALPALAGDKAGPVPSDGPAMTSLTDGALLERVTQGDTDAFTVLYRRYERPVFAMLYRLASGRRALAEEWLQEAFTRVWLGAATHDPARGEVRPWIYKIALNTARSEMARKRYRTPHISIDDAGLDMPAEADGEEGIAGRLDDARQAIVFAAALDRLPDYLREVVVLRCSRDLTFAEIAVATGVPQGTLKSRFHRAVTALRQAVRPGRRKAR